MIENIRFSISKSEEEAILERIASSSKIVITSHQNPDGDAVGSLLGLFHILSTKGKNCTCLLPDRFTSFLNWMPGTDQIQFFDEDKVNGKKLLTDADLIFVLDYNAPSRVGQEMGAVLAQAPASKIMIDHHPQPDPFCTHTFSYTTECSTAQMVYRFAATLGYTQFINKDAATCLYTGIMTDTGSFRFPATTALTHYIIAQLIECGAENAAIHNAVYDTNTADRLRLLGYTLSSKLVVLPEHKVAYMSLIKDELEKFQHQKGDTEGFVNYGLSINGVLFAAIFMEKDDQIKISFRSKGKVPVNEFMSANFSGGGHLNAAGGRSNDSMDVTIQRFLSLIPDFMKKHG